MKKSINIIFGMVITILFGYQNQTLTSNYSSTPIWTQRHKDAFNSIHQVESSLEKNKNIDKKIKKLKKQVEQLKGSELYATQFRWTLHHTAKSVNLTTMPEKNVKLWKKITQHLNPHKQSLHYTKA